MLTSRLDYELPPELIAQEPLADRGASRLLVLRKRDGTIEHRRFAELPELLARNDLLVVNNTKVRPARIHGFRESSGGVVEVFVTEETSADRIRAITGSRGRLLVGERLYATRDGAPGAPALVLELLARLEDGTWEIGISVPTAEGSSASPLQVLRELGQMPLPPYIRRARFRDAHDASDRERYQTVYASQEGAVAAPTAGLHFTAGLLERLAASGVSRAEVTLHVGIGTFRPVTADDLADHVMHEEWYEMGAVASEAVAGARAGGGRVLAVGTTSARVLETCGGAAGSGVTRLMITPGYQWRAVDALVTNFHQPRSTLLAMVMALGGEDPVRRAYAAAVSERYRFLSYGDAMLII